jgi:hypothetical protein
MKAAESWDHYSEKNFFPPCAAKIVPGPFPPSPESKHSGPGQAGNALLSARSAYEPDGPKVHRSEPGDWKEKRPLPVGDLAQPYMICYIESASNQQKNLT